MALIVMPSLLSKRPWARIRARCEASFFIVLSKSARCCSVRGRTYLTLIALEIGFTYRIVLELERERLYQKTFGRALMAKLIQSPLVVGLVISIVVFLSVLGFRLAGSFEALELAIY